MTDLVTEEAVEAAARAYLRGDRMGVGENSSRHRSGILSALTAAARQNAQATADLRAGIKALRDEWQDSEDEVYAPGRYDLCMEHAAALDALLRERAK